MWLLKTDLMRPFSDFKFHRLPIVSTLCVTYVFTCVYRVWCLLYPVPASHEALYYWSLSISQEICKQVYSVHYVLYAGCWRGIVVHVRQDRHALYGLCVCSGVCVFTLHSVFSATLISATQ